MPNFENFLNQNVIVRFVGWNVSKCKNDLDLLHSFFINRADSLPNLLFIKDGPALVRIDKIYRQWILLFNHKDRIFYIRDIEDIMEIEAFNGSEYDIQDFLKSYQNQEDNKPYFNPVFKNDPSGVLASFEATKRCFVVQMEMLRIMAVNFCVKDSVLYNQEFLLKAKTKYSEIGKDFPPLRREFIEFVITDFSPLYDLLIERGALYGDVKYIRLFGRYENMTSKDLKQGCFIATAVYGSPYARQVITFTHFRDNYLSGNTLGKLFIRWYYRFSPFLASKIENRESAKIFIRILLLNPLHSILRLALKKLVICNDRWD